MGAIGWTLMEGYEEGHKAISTALQDLGRLGYLVQGISCKGGLLEAVFACPRKTKDSGCSMDKVSKSDKASPETEYSSTGEG